MQPINKTLGVGAAMMVALTLARLACAQGQVAPAPPNNGVGTNATLGGPNAEFGKVMDAIYKRIGDADAKAQKLLEAGHLAEAEQACYEALAINPKYPYIESQQLLGDVYREQGRYKEAIEMYQKSLTHGEGDDAVPLYFAWCYLKMGDLPSARKFYSPKQQALVVGKRDQAAYLGMLPGDKTAKQMEISLILALGGHRDAHGERLWKKVLVLAPQNALAAWWIANDLDFLGKRDEAAPYWARAAVFGRGFVAREGRIEVRNHLMPDKAAQALRDAKRIR